MRDTNIIDLILNSGVRDRPDKQLIAISYTLANITSIMKYEGVDIEV